MTRVLVEVLCRRVPYDCEWACVTVGQQPCHQERVPEGLVLMFPYWTVAEANDVAEHLTCSGLPTRVTWVQ